MLQNLVPIKAVSKYRIRAVLVRYCQINQLMAVKLGIWGLQIDQPIPVELGSVVPTALVAYHIGVSRIMVTTVDNKSSRDKVLDLR